MGNQCQSCPSQIQPLEVQGKRIMLVGIEDNNFLMLFTQGAIKIGNLPNLNIPKVAKETIERQHKKQKQQIDQKQLQIWKLQFPRKCIFVGNIEKNKLPNGFARVYMLNAQNQFDQYYQGRVVNCQANDTSALYVMKNGSLYKGGVKKNKAQGVGIYQSSDNSVQYQGDWENNVPHGHGTCKSSEGTYQGNFNKGVKSGQGKFEWRDGSLYNGEFRDGKITGKGNLKSNGCVYDGEFVNGVQHGIGQWHGFNQKYVGEFRDGKKSGKGKFIFESGSVYEGEFKNQKPHGNGKLIKDGKQLSGIWINGRNICIVDK